MKKELTDKVRISHVLESIIFVIVSKFLKILLAFLIGVFFSMAVLEVNTFGLENTFLDEYDFSLQTDNSPIQYSCSFERSNNVEFHVDIAPQYFLQPNTDPLFNFYKDSFGDPSFSRLKLFIAHSSLLI